VSDPIARRWAADPDQPAIDAVFRHWRDVMGFPARKLNAARRKHLKARVGDGYTVEQLKRAVDWTRLSAFHMGENDTGTPYNDIDSIFRSADRVDKRLGPPPRKQVRDAATAGIVLGRHHASLTDMRPPAPGEVVVETRF
jgi:hypothetical protein